MLYNMLRTAFRKAFRKAFRSAFRKAFREAFRKTPFVTPPVVKHTVQAFAKRSGAEAPLAIVTWLVLFRSGRMPSDLRKDPDICERLYGMLYGRLYGRL